jgi:hypothetical protein
MTPAGYTYLKASIERSTPATFGRRRSRQPAPVTNIAETF